MANLIHLIHRFPPALGGAETVALRVCQHLGQNGHRIRVETTTALDPDSFHRPGTDTLESGITHQEGIETRRHQILRFPLQRPILGTLQRIAPRRFRPWLNWYSPICPGLFQLAKDPDLTPDAVIVWALPHGSIWAAARRLARIKKVPLISIPFLHPGNPLRPNCPIQKAFRHPWLREILRESARVICLTEWEKAELVQEGVPEDRLVVTGLGQDPQAVTGGDRDRFRARWRISPDQFLVGHLATLSSDKGTLDLLEARARLPHENKIVVLLAGVATAGFLKKAKPYLDRPWLRVTDRLDDVERRDFFAACDLLCLPSLVESWSLVLLEAWSAGVGVSVYDAGGPGALVRQGRDGWKIPPGNISLLAEFLAGAPAQTDTIKGWGLEGRTRVWEEFGWAEALTKLEKAIVTLL